MANISITSNPSASSRIGSQPILVPQPPPEKARAARDPSSSRPASRPHAVGHLEGREQVGESLADLLLGEEAYVRLFFLIQRRQPERPILPLSPLLHEDPVAPAERVQREADPALLGTSAHGAVSVIAQHSSAPSGEARLAEELAPLGPGTGPRPLSVLHSAIQTVRHATLSPENLRGGSIGSPKSRGHEDSQPSLPPGVATSPVRCVPLAIKYKGGLARQLMNRDTKTSSLVIRSPLRTEDSEGQTGSTKYGLAHGTAQRPGSPLSSVDADVERAAIATIV